MGHGLLVFLDLHKCCQMRTGTYDGSCGSRCVCLMQQAAQCAWVNTWKGYQCEHAALFGGVSGVFGIWELVASLMLQ